MLQPGPFPRVICELCGRDVAARKDGAAREHNCHHGKLCTGLPPTIGSCKACVNKYYLQRAARTSAHANARAGE